MENSQQKRSIKLATAPESRKPSSSVGSANESFTKSISRISLTQATCADVVDPVDFEEALVIQRKSGILEKVGPTVARAFADYPQDDIQAKTVPRECRTLDSPIPARLITEDKLDKHTRDCISAYISNSVVVGRKYQQYATGPSYRTHCAQRSYITQNLPRQVYEADLDDARLLNDIPDGEVASRSSCASFTSDSTGGSTGTGTSNPESGINLRISGRNSCAQDLEQSSGDPLIPGIVDRVEPQVLDVKNAERRQLGRHNNLFALYPLQHEDDVIERKDPASPPMDVFGHRLLVKVLQLRLEFEVEPIFASMALYDAKERKKISENFYFDMNSELIKGMLKLHVPFQDVSTMARSAIFSVSYPSPELYLVIKLERVLQAGGTESAEAFAKDDKKFKSQAIEWCDRLGAYRMPFAWTAVYLLNVFTGANSLEACSTSVTSEAGGTGTLSSDTDSLNSATLERRSRMSSSMRYTTSSVDSPLVRKGSMGASTRVSTHGAAILEEIGANIDSFKPTSITINNFYKQETDRMSDDDLFRMLADVKKPSLLSKKLKCIAGTLKLDICPCPPSMEGCLSPEHLRIHPYPNLEARPTKEILEFPSKEVFVPNFSYRNLIYIYPKAVNFSTRPGSARNIAVMVQLMAGEEPNSALPVIFGKSGCPEFQTQAYTGVTYHSKTPMFYDEIKAKLPADLSDQHHLLFTFYHISCKLKTAADAGSVSPVESAIGYAWLPLFKDGVLQTGEISLPVALEQLPTSYSYLSPDVNLPNMKWLDGHKRLFTVSVEISSTIHTQDEHLNRFLRLYHCVTSPSKSTAAKPQETASLEHDLRRSIQDLTKAKPEPLVYFLYIVLDKLIDLMVYPPVVGGETVNVGQTCFEMIGQLVKILTFLLDSYCDHHGRSSLLTTYIQYSSHLSQPVTRRPSCVAPTGYSRADQASHKNELLEIIKGQERSASYKEQKTATRNVHEEIAANWVVSSGSAKEMATANSWFFLELLAKSMSEYLAGSSRLYLPKRLRFSERFLDYVTTLIMNLTGEVITRSPRDFRMSQSINTSLGFFVCELLSLLDRSFTFGLIKTYCKYMGSAMSSTTDCGNMMLLRLEFLRIVSSHEHFITLNLPLLQISDSTLPPLPAFTGPIVPPAPTVSHGEQGSPSPTPSIASRNSANSAGQQSSRSSICTGGSGSMGAADLVTEFRSRHFLLGLVLSDLAVAWETGNRGLHQKAVNIVRNLVTCHDLDARYSADNIKQIISKLYMPLVGLVMDSCAQLCDPYCKQKPSSARNSAVVEDGNVTITDFSGDELNPTVALAIAHGTIPSISQGQGTPAPDGGALSLALRGGRKTCFSLEATRSILVCFCWVMKNLNKQHLRQWLNELSQPRLCQLLDVLQLCISCFEYKGYGVMSARTAEGESASSGGCRSMRLRTKLEEALIGGQNLRTEFMNNRKGSNQAASGSMTASFAAGMPSSSLTPSTGVRWRKDQIQYRQTVDYYEKLKPEMENDALTEGNLATEISLIVLDVVETLIHSLSQGGSSGMPSGILNFSVRVILHMLSCNQSILVLQNLFASQRALVANYPWLILEDDTEQCSDLCMYLLKHCSSPLAEVRSQAAASLYLLMRQSFESGVNFARVKMQITVSLSSLVGAGQYVNEEHLRRSLRTIVTYAEQDSSCDMQGELMDTTFAEQVRDLGFNLHMILCDTVKMKEHEHDFEMLIDLMYRIAKGYQNSPDLRLTWLQSMAQKHADRQNFAEAAQCLVHAAALVAEYLNMIEDVPYRPLGCVTFLSLSDNVLEESAVSDDIVSPDEDGICESRYFTELGLCQLMEQTAHYLNLAQMFEGAHEMYKLYTPILQHHRNFKKIAEIYSTLSEILAKVTEKRIFGTFYRVALYGAKFGDLDGVEFIYKEPAITKLPEISHRLESFYAGLFGGDFVEIIKHSNTVERARLNPEKVYIQITFVEPFFDRWELRHRPTYFEKNMQLRRFMYASPFTLDGRNHGGLADQYKRKTILTTSHSFPYVKTRIQVINREQIVLTPIEVAIEDLQKKTSELAAATGQSPPDAKMLQMVLQGCIGTTVNQGPMEVANVFLSAAMNDPNAPPLDEHQTKLRLCFKDFSKKCADALRENKQLIGPDQKDYQKELERNYVSFTEKLAPMVTAAPLICETLRRHHRRRAEVEQQNDV